VDEIESWEPNEIPARARDFDRYTTTRKLPDNIRKLALECDVDESSARDSEKSFLDDLGAQIINFQLEKILQKNPKKYKCVTCQKAPATRSVSMICRAVNNTTWSLHVFPSFPVCDSTKCSLIASKCAEKMLSTLASVTGQEKISPSEVVTQCNNCERLNYGGESERLNCSRCNIACYCNVECQKAHWPKHKKACKLVTCQHCEKLETTKLFSMCARCQQVFYCGRDCQLNDWRNHKKDCKKK
jgi:hypothetical protein